jgi:hypothetical protein
VTELDQEPTLFGLFRKRARTRTAVNQAATSWQKNHAETVVESLATQAAAGTEPAAPATGTTTELVQEPTLFGLFRKRTRTRTAVAQSASVTFACNNGNDPGQMTIYWWENQASGYGKGLMDGVSANARKSLSARLNEFALEDGSASVFVPTTVVTQTPDSVPVGMITTTLTQQRVKDVVAADGTITGTKTQDVTYEEYTKYVATMANAESAIEDMATAAGTAGGALAERGIRPYTTNGGNRMYIAEGKSTPLTYGSWVTAAAPP